MFGVQQLQHKANNSRDYSHNVDVKYQTLNLPWKDYLAILLIQGWGILPH